MQKQLEMHFNTVMETMRTVRRFNHASKLVNFDMETICPPKGMEEQGETAAFLSTEAYKLKKDPAFIEAAEYCYENRFGSGTKEAPGEDGLSEPARALVEMLHRQYTEEKNVLPEKQNEWQVLLNRAYVRWLEAKEKSDFSIFAPSLKEVRDMDIEMVNLRTEHTGPVYDGLLGDYERGVTQADIDAWFGECKERMIPMLEKIKASKKEIRTDFLTRYVPVHKQEAICRMLLDTIGFDFTRGALTTTEHPFMDGLGKNDIRVTTHYHENLFVSNIFSIVHEGGHALFGQRQPLVNYDYFVDDEMTMGMHESVSRFYENRIGRSRPFVHLIYPKVKEIVGDVLDDVSEEEFYEGINLVEPSLVRLEADEFTYTFHIIIRYELEKRILDGSLALEDIPKAWADKYEEYLGLRPTNDTEGVLQDMHWSFGLGYFPTYAIGNMYNAMYFNRMKQEIPVDQLIANNEIRKIDEWMAENVFAKACYRTPKEWILGITGRPMTPKDFLDYLEEKYGELYGF